MCSEGIGGVTPQAGEVVNQYGMYLVRHRQLFLTSAVACSSDLIFKYSYSVAFKVESNQVSGYSVVVFLAT